MYTWVIVINKTRKQKFPTQKNKETNKKSARKTSEEIVAEENNRQTDRQTDRHTYTGQQVFFCSPNTREELLC